MSVCKPVSVCAESAAVSRLSVLSHGQQMRSQSQGHSPSSSEHSQPVVLLSQSENSDDSESGAMAPSVQLGRIYNNHQINFFNNNDDLFLGASAGAIGSAVHPQPQPATALENSQIGSGERGKNKGKKGGNKADKFNRFKQKVVEREEIQQTWENNVKR